MCISNIKRGVKLNELHKQTLKKMCLKPEVLHKEELSINEKVFKEYLFPQMPAIAFRQLCISQIAITNAIIKLN